MLYFGNTHKEYDDNGNIVARGIDYLAYPGDSEVLILPHEQYDEILTYAQDPYSPTAPEWYHGLNDFYRNNHRGLNPEDKALIERWLHGMSRDFWSSKPSSNLGMY